MTTNNIQIQEGVQVLPLQSVQLTIPNGADRQIVFWDDMGDAHEAALIEITQEADSRLSIIFLSLNQSRETRLAISQVGEHAETSFFGLSITGETHTHHLHTRILHGVSNGKSRQLYKSIVGGKAHSAFVGELKVLPHAQKTEAYQTNRNILLSETAKMQTQPQLEIYADDVKCSHGATTGHLDESALFYMQQRCISPSSARLLLLSAFAADILQEVRDEGLRETLEGAVTAMIQSLYLQQ